MITPTGWWLATAPIDLRCGIDRLLVLVPGHHLFHLCTEALLASGPSLAGVLGIAKGKLRHISESTGARRSIRP